MRRTRARSSGELSQRGLPMSSSASPPTGRGWCRECAGLMAKPFRSGWGRTCCPCRRPATRTAPLERDRNASTTRFAAITRSRNGPYQCCTRRRREVFPFVDPMPPMNRATAAGTKSHRQEHRAGQRQHHRRTPSGGTSFPSHAAHRLRSAGTPPWMMRPNRLDFDAAEHLGGEVLAAEHATQPWRVAQGDAGSFR